MKAPSIALHQLRANWPEIVRTSVLSAIGIAVGSWLMFFEIPGQFGWTNAIGVAGRCVFAGVWMLVCVSLVVFIGRDRLGDQSQFFQTRPVSRWLRMLSSSLLALFVAMLLAVAPVFFGAWLFNFPPGWTSIAVRWAGVGIFVLMVVLALFWSRSRDGWLRTRLLLAGIGMFLGYLLLVELRAWVPIDGFAWLGKFPAWLALVLLGTISFGVLVVSLRRPGGLPGGVFVAFGALGSLVVLGEVGWSRAGDDAPEAEFAGWGELFGDGEIDAVGRTPFFRGREGFELTMPDFDAGRCALHIGFSGRLVDAEGTEILKLDRVAVERGEDEIKFDTNGGSVSAVETVEPLARFVGLEGDGIAEGTNRDAAAKVGSPSLRLRLLSGVSNGDALREAVVDGGEYFVEGELEVLYREVVEIGRGATSDGVRAKIPGVRIRLEPLVSEFDRNIRRVRGRLLHAPLPNPSKRRFAAHKADQFVVFVDPAGADEPWRAFSMRRLEGAGWISEFDGGQWVVNSQVARGLKDGGEFICVAQYPARQVTLPVRLKVGQVDRLGKYYSHGKENEGR